MHKSTLAAACCIVVIWPAPANAVLVGTNITLSGFGALSHSTQSTTVTVESASGLYLVR